MKFRISGKLLIILEKSMEYKEKPKDHNMQPVGLGSTSILTTYAQKSPRPAPSKRLVLGSAGAISTMIDAISPPTEHQQMYIAIPHHDS